MSSGATMRLDTAPLDKMIRELGPQADDWLNGVAQQINGEIKASFGSSPPGREYKRRGVIHVASRPGFPPNTDTGALVGSLRVNKVRARHYEIMDGVEYGVFLEDGIGMAARPFVRPIFEAWRVKIHNAALTGLIP